MLLLDFKDEETEFLKRFYQIIGAKIMKDLTLSYDFTLSKIKAKNFNTET